MSLGNKWGGNVGRIMQHQVLKREKNCCGESNTKHPHSEQQPLRFIAGIKVTIRVKGKKINTSTKREQMYSNKPTKSINQSNHSKFNTTANEEEGGGRLGAG